MTALFFIESFPFPLPARFLPRREPNGNVFGWGPFFGGLRNEFGSIEDSTVKKFQRQAGDLVEDGKAGIETLKRLDEIVLFLEAHVSRDAQIVFEQRVNTRFSKGL
jgi:hypothetical protein